MCIFCCKAEDVSKDDKPENRVDRMFKYCSKSANTDQESSRIQQSNSIGDYKLYLLKYRQLAELNLSIIKLVYKLVPLYSCFVFDIV